MAKFLVSGMFTLKSRGVVVAGDITGGEISAGDKIQFLTDDLPILSVEY